MTSFPDNTLLILTRQRANASFRQRIEPYIGFLGQAGLACEVVELSENILRRSRQLARAGRSPAVWLHRKTLTVWDARMLGRRARVIYDFDDAVMFQARDSEAGPHAGRLRRFTRTVRRSTLTLAGNEILAGQARSVGAGNVAVVPTGLDASRYAPKADDGRGGPLRLVWIGSRSTLKQLQRRQDVLEALRARLPGLSLRIIADAPLAVPGLTVENVAWTHEGEARMLAECDIGIAPLPDTNFTRGKCGFKILQYMAAGLPVVASPVGVQRDFVRDGVNGYCAVSTEQWLAAIERLAGDVDLRRRLGSAGRTRVEQEFDFRVLAPRVCELIRGSLS